MRSDIDETLAMGAASSAEHAGPASIAVWQSTASEDNEKHAWTRNASRIHAFNFMLSTPLACVQECDEYEYMEAWCMGWTAMYHHPYYSYSVLVQQVVQTGSWDGRGLVPWPLTQLPRPSPPSR